MTLSASFLALLASAATVGLASAYHDEYDGSGAPWGGDAKPAYDYGTGGSYSGPWPYTCAFQPEAQLQLYQCLTPGTAICRDGWAFGIDQKDGYVKLWNGDKVVFQQWPGARKLCIGEKDGYLRSTKPSYWWYDAEIPYIFVMFDDGLSNAYLHCKGIGREDKDALLKIVDLGEDYLYEEPVVKFKKGPGYENALWWINAKGDAVAGPGCDWYLDTREPTATPSATPSALPSVSPSAMPSAVPTPNTANPSSTPSISSAPSDVPTESPSASPSKMTDVPSASPSRITDAPSGAPTTSAAPSAIPSGTPSTSPTATPSDVPSSTPSSSPSSAPSISCPCWSVVELEAVTAANQRSKSCVRTLSSTYWGPLVFTWLQNTPGSTPYKEGGFRTGSYNYFYPGAVFCQTRDEGRFKWLNFEEFEACTGQIEARCDAIGKPIGGAAAAAEGAADDQSVAQEEQSATEGAAEEPSDEDLKGNLPDWS